jgi:hypothetical protein
MKTVSRIVIIGVALLIAAGIAFLATWDIPPPKTPVEKIVPSDRFPR